MPCRVRGKDSCDSAVAIYGQDPAARKWATGCSVLSGFGIPPPQ
jgi:hypothetical protein